VTSAGSSLPFEGGFASNAESAVTLDMQLSHIVGGLKLPRELPGVTLGLPKVEGDVLTSAANWRTHD